MTEVRLRGGDTLYWGGKTLAVLHAPQAGKRPTSVPSDVPLFDLRLLTAGPVPCVWAREAGKPGAPAFKLTLDRLLWVEEVPHG